MEEAKIIKAKDRLKSDVEESLKLFRKDYPSFNIELNGGSGINRWKDDETWVDVKITFGVYNKF